MSIRVYLRGFRIKGVGLCWNWIRKGKYRISERERREDVFGNSEGWFLYTVENFESIYKLVEDVGEILGYKSHLQGPHRVQEGCYDSVDDIISELLKRQYMFYRSGVFIL